MPFFIFAKRKPILTVPSEYFTNQSQHGFIKRKKRPSQAKYTINKDTLNERYDYSVKKQPGVFRIMTIGDSFTYGLYTNTDRNWTELLEDKLNADLRCQKSRKVEVINLAVNGYDITYTVERFLKRGIKYNPDLVIWPIRSFKKLNEEIN
jgi:lysophospholipase L1-like esterase